ncbi:hypothetical protein A0128_07100 [Leptospira tipperaryensis]|uniref:Uncharacterized protein n=1 Tax=Leptospira tipperaryensis TaxID=2564040 RepID=A0A1D7UVJ9_9LEPT|nr:hypothetical protein A0128_07100 [Leptospira tipperaryensis]
MVSLVDDWKEIYGTVSPYHNLHRVFFACIILQTLLKKNKDPDKTFRGIAGLYKALRLRRAILRSMNISICERTEIRKKSSLEILRWNHFQKRMNDSKGFV